MWRIKLKDWNMPLAIIHWGLLKLQVLLWMNLHRVAGPIIIQLFNSKINGICFIMIKIILHGLIKPVQ